MTKAIALGLALGLMCTATGACSKGDDDSAGDHGSSAKNDNGGSATETNVAPIHCFEDADCTSGKCEHFPGQDGACSGSGKPGGPYHPGQDDGEDGGTVSGPNTR